MMRRSLVVTGVLLMALAIASVLYAQAPGGGRGTWGQQGQMTEAQRAEMREQMMERMLEQTGLTETEKAAAKKAIRAKDQARQALTEQLTKLRATANAPTSTNQELQNAQTTYWAAMTGYYQKVQAEDQSLMKQLSLLSQVQCLSLGILENGLGRMGGMRQPRGTGMAGPGQ